MKLFCISVLASMLSCASSAQAATYVMDFDETVERHNLQGTFDIDPFTDISAASVEFTLRGKTSMVNSRGYAWYYDPNIDLSIGGTQFLDDHHLGGEFTTLHFDLGPSTIDQMIAALSLDFDIAAQLGYWWSDLSPWGGYTRAPFYLDSASLNVTPSAVPLPAAAWLFGSGVLGLAGFSARKRK